MAAIIRAGQLINTALDPGAYPQHYKAKITSTTLEGEEPCGHVWLNSWSQGEGNKWYIHWYTGLAG